MIGRVYSVTFSAVAVTGAQDLFEITPADDKPVEIVGIELGQSSDAGDAAGIPPAAVAEAPRPRRR